MAGKDRRVAARQAQLGRRRKRQQKAPSGVSLPGPGLAPAPTNADGETSTVAGLESPQSVAAAVAPTSAAAPVSPRSAPPRTSSRAASQPFARVRGERPPAQNYIKAELKRILIMGGSVLATIIVLGVIL